MSQTYASPLFTSISHSAENRTGEKYPGPDADGLGLDIDVREKALVWKQDLRIVPLCAAIYLLCYLDRSNIGMLSGRSAGRFLVKVCD